VASDPRGRGIAAYIGIGSNLDNPAAQVSQALSELERLPGSSLAECSALYRTAPVGLRDQPDYVNAAVRIETRLGADDLLAALQAIERRHGRLRGGIRWGPRTLDLDILLYGEEIIDRPGLRVPHPEMTSRAFVLVPLADIAPLDLRIPRAGTLGSCLDAVPRDGVQPLTTDH
jgi:2-amino-4-hydroxy-6-hydroxymethyldihydropteridine diphosphokinase